MSLFEQDPAAVVVPVQAPAPRRVRVGRWLVGAGVVALLILGFSPTPYVIEQPGPVFNTLGVDASLGASATGNGKPVISISGAKTYPTKGALDLLTVNVVGNPQSLPNWFQVAWAWFFRSKAVVPVGVEFPSGQTADQANTQNAQMMSSAQQDATAAALNSLGYHFTQNVVVAQIEKGSPADGTLKAGDKITAVDGSTIIGVQSLRDDVQKDVGKPSQLTVDRGGKSLQLSVTATKEDGAWTLGVYAGVEYGTFPVKVGFQLEDIGGPSAGQMFALGIIDKLTPGLLNGGLKVAGTGTIDNEGNVGAIGGIRQKLYGARQAGATVFLAPASNCDEVVGHIPSGLDVYAVNTLQESLKVLKTVSDHGNTSGLPTCHK